ncbi:hypothetical protein BOTBODRAFT_177106 [Botryobasidium botryosum FD-172 SS1]|uniref:Uncharacterized protein n=1 Tax=Botryobasidium botryosum (strain FD-172 SS1) TaxID=930990 RepID=A0A067M818_BOTB1|nr:hypothetical protein BOTBODRAFT_177106 [Botryobasidium botryosum FD-172 SS1]
MVVTQKLKGWEKHSLDSTSAGNTTARDKPDGVPVFSIEGFLECLARWIVVDDQSFNVVESPEFRDLLAFIGAAAGQDPGLS